MWYYLLQHIRVIIEDIEDGGFVADKENRSDWWSEFINRRAKAYGEQKNDFEEKLKETFAQYASKLGWAAFKCELALCEII